MNYTFVVQVGEKFWGPFKTADAAVKWAKKNINENHNWIIRPVERS